MKKNLLSLLLILFTYFSAFSQAGLFKFTKSYFRSDPLTGEFSSFLKHLLNDPTIREKETRQRTDTSLFYFSGIYTNYNPFFFKPKRLQVKLEQVSIQYTDSIPADTILAYQLWAYADSSPAGEQDIKKEFAKIHRQFSKKFYDSNYQELKTGKETNGGAHNYSVSLTNIAPVTVAWSKLKDGGYVLILLLRIKIQGNTALLPATFYNP